MTEPLRSGGEDVSGEDVSGEDASGEDVSGEDASERNPPYALNPASSPGPTGRGDG